MSKKLEITVKFFDESKCTRCIDIISLIEEAISQMKLKYKELEIDYKKIKVNTDEIEISPTIYINNIDLERLIKQDNFFEQKSSCSDCSNIIGKDVCCRSYDSNTMTLSKIIEILELQILL